MKIRSSLKLLTLLVILISSVQFGSAQTNEAIAIKGATIVTVSGANITNGVLVIRNGLIEAVGADVAIPADAKVIDATGMMVYPGLIDAYSNYGLKPPTPPAGGPQNFAAQLAATPSTVGMLPEATVVDQLQVTPETFDQQRNVGITAALTAPREGIFQGRSALINLGAESSEKLLLKSPVSLNVAFVPGRGGFPNSLMGTFAFLRQMFLDAQHYRDEWDWYSKSPRGKTRPQHNKSLEALIPIVNGKMPIIFNVSSEREIRRAVALAEEFNLKYFLGGATQSYQVAEFLKAKNATVLLSLSFPQKPNLEDPEDEPLRSLQERANAPKAAAELQKAGVKFAFSSGTLARSTDFLANAAKTIEAGLPKDEALKALTLYPAQIFGVAEQLGSIEKGKIANLVVASGDLFNKDTKIKFTFVDGKQFIVKAPETPPAGNGRPGGGRNPNGGAPPANTGGVNIAGAWVLKLNTPQGVFDSPLNIQQNGENITGDIGSPAGTVQISNGKFSNNELTFSYSINFNGQQLNISARGKIEGNNISGSMETMGTTFDFSGSRKPQ